MLKWGIPIKEGRDKEMPDSEAKKQWMKENTVIITTRLNRNQDKDIFEYLDGKKPATEIKKGLRLLTELEKASSAQPAEEQ